MSDPKSIREQVLALGDELAALEWFEPREAVERRVAMNARRERLDRAKPAITDQDELDIIHDRLRSTHALRVVHRWITLAFRGGGAQVPRFLVLAGERGLGKTVAAAWAIANEVGMYVTAGEARRLRGSYNAQDADELRRLQHTRLLVLDDLGAERQDEGSEELLFELVNARQKGCYTLITTNLDEPTLRARYGDRAVDRVAHQGGIVALTGENLRRTTFG